jgi:hypothetical protein
MDEGGDGHLHPVPSIMEDSQIGSDVRVKCSAHNGVARTLLDNNL